MKFVRTYFVVETLLPCNNDALVQPSATGASLSFPLSKIIKQNLALCRVQLNPVSSDTQTLNLLTHIPHMQVLLRDPTGKKAKECSTPLKIALIPHASKVMLKIL